MPFPQIDQEGYEFLLDGIEATFAYVVNTIIYDILPEAVVDFAAFIMNVVTSKPEYVFFFMVGLSVLMMYTLVGDPRDSGDSGVMFAMSRRSLRKTNESEGMAYATQALERGSMEGLTTHQKYLASQQMDKARRQYELQGRSAKDFSGAQSQPVLEVVPYDREYRNVKGAKRRVDKQISAKEKERLDKRLKSDKVRQDQFRKSHLKTTKDATVIKQSGFLIGRLESDKIDRKRFNDTMNKKERKKDKKKFKKTRRWKKGKDKNLDGTERKGPQGRKRKRGRRASPKKLAEQLRDEAIEISNSPKVKAVNERRKKKGKSSVGFGLRSKVGDIITEGGRKYRITHINAQGRIYKTPVVKSIQRRGSIHNPFTGGRFRAKVNVPIKSKKRLI